jgi:hypothetical protein
MWRRSAVSTPAHLSPCGRGVRDGEVHRVYHCESAILNDPWRLLPAIPAQSCLIDIARSSCPMIHHFLT